MLSDFQIVSCIRTSFLDWSGHVTVTVFTSGCNFACPWCNNGALVTSHHTLLSNSEILADIRHRKDFLDGVCVSGGEPTLQRGLPQFLQEVKHIGLATKLDTNGTNPEVLQSLITNGLVDFVAMDVKAPLRDVPYSRLTGKMITQDMLSKISHSIDIIKAIPHEFRTTYVPSLHTLQDLRDVKQKLDDPSWVIQCFKPLSTLDKNFMSELPASKKDMEKYFPDITIRE